MQNQKTWKRLKVLGLTGEEEMFYRKWDLYYLAHFEKIRQERLAKERADAGED